MRDFFFHLTPWHWVGLGILTFIIEVLTGTGFLLWVGGAAVLVSLLVFIFPALPVAAQFILFSALAILGALLWRYLLQPRTPSSLDSTLNRRAQQYVGRVFTLQQPIINGMGTINVDDSMWRVKCDEDLKTGVKVHVVKAEGVFLIVEKK